MTNNSNILINLYKGKNYCLQINTNASDYRINLTNKKYKNPETASNFCMILRKYLAGKTLEKIYMNGLERICYIVFSGFNEMNDKINLKLVVELMGKYSNVILLNDKDYIIDGTSKFDRDEENNGKRKIYYDWKKIYFT